ncbi:histone-lysine N-methyltransferase SETMAR [Trichonephila clavipes]|nr:histone-lysine N-methyltransferase SETMAR [Trichonephila clavipes]
MLRTKPQYLSVLGRKRSSIRSPQKQSPSEESCCVSKLRCCLCVVVMFCSISYGVVLLLCKDASTLTASTLLVPLIVAAVASVSGGFGWDVFGHPSYSPDLTPSDFHLFLHFKSFLADKHFNNDKELKENVSNWLKTQAATFSEEGIEKLVPRYDTCLQNFGSYVER